jgi:hypothetical protein
MLLNFLHQKHYIHGHINQRSLGGFYVHELLNSVFVILYSVFCILYSVFCILYSVFCILYSVLCILYSVFCILYSVFCVLCSINTLRTCFCFRDLLHDGTANLPAGLQHLDWSLEHVQRHCHRPPLLLWGDLHEEVPGPPPHVHRCHRHQHHQPHCA